MPGRLQWASGIAIALGSLQAIAGLVFCVAPQLGTKLGATRLMAGVVFVVGVALAAAAIATLRKQRSARFVLLGIVAVLCGLPVLIQLAMLLGAREPEPNLLAILVPASYLGFYAWAVCSRRTRQYFARLYGAPEARGPGALPCA